MKVSNCLECGKLYLENIRNLCPECSLEYDKQIERISEHLKNISKATISEISAATGVKTSVISKLMQKGFFLNSNCHIFYSCESCGTLIQQGRICESCREIINDFCRRTFAAKNPEIITEKSRSKGNRFQTNRKRIF